LLSLFSLLPDLKTNNVTRLITLIDSIIFFRFLCFDLSNINTFLDEKNIERITIKYQGGGDDGYIENTGVDDKGDEYSLSAGMEDVVYSYLEQSFGGWENNEGASGGIIVTKEEIQIDHIWNTREDVDSDLHLVIKLEDVE
jgi:hypothetical protein